MKKWIEVSFEIGDMVYLKTDPDQNKRMVTRISIGGLNNLTYELTLGTLTSWHYEFEISREQDIELKTSNQ